MCSQVRTFPLVDMPNSSDRGMTPTASRAVTRQGGKIGFSALN